MSIIVAKNLGSKNKDILINFYTKNNDNNIGYTKKDPNSLIVCSYNVHGWVNINSKITPPDNFVNIFNMFENYQNIDIIVLQEVCFRDNLTEDYITTQFKQIGFSDSFTVPNGGCFLDCKATDYIMIFGKELFTIKKEIDVTKLRWKRSCLIVHYRGVNILAVHLEIGKNIHYLPLNAYRKKLEAENAKCRIDQLDILLKNDIDMLIGDFNFTPDDLEFKWLLTRNFVFCNDITHTTPFNRTDMVFINDKINNINNKVINCNYSDHLLVISENIIS